MDKYYFIFAAAIIVVILTAFTLIIKHIQRRRDRMYAKALFGSTPDGTPVCFDSIEELYKRQLKSRSEYVDDITMNDLDMRDIFTSLDTCMTSPGEEMLYSQLHFCDSSVRRQIMSLCQLMSQDADLRTDIYTELRNMGILNYSGAPAIVCGEPMKKIERRWLYILLPALPFLCLPLVAVNGALGVLAVVMTFAVNFVCYYFNKKKFLLYLGGAAYIAQATAAAERLVRRQCIAELFPDLKINTAKLHDIIRYIRLLRQSTPDLDVFNDITKAPFQLEVHSYCSLRNILKDKNDTAYYIYTAVGIMDAACAVLNYRENLHTWCEPRFTAENTLHAQGLYHPLIKNAVPNDVYIEHDLLLTGSNASGKSSFIKACAVNAIFAQSIGICTAESFSAGENRVVTSMAVRDNIIDGDSYFMAELRSMHRLVHLAQSEPCICFVDEILKGTNTAERIAASESVLEALAKTSSLCVAATHDSELTEMPNGYVNMHFTEQIEQGGVTFDYKIRSGAAKTRNAILLMEQLDFGENITKRARELADQ